MTKTLAVIGAGVEAVHGILIAKEMGLNLVVIDGNPKAPGFEYADKSLVISTYDASKIASTLTELNSLTPIDGVIAMCADVPLSVATAAQALDLPGLTPTDAQALADKYLMKEKLSAANIAIPKYFALTTEAELPTIATELGFPFVIKPVDSRGARGVQLIDNENQFKESFQLALDESTSGVVIAEEYISGPQISTETLIENGRCYTIGFSDRNYEWLEQTKPFMIENGGDAPSFLNDEEQKQICELAEKASIALGITHGTSKGDMVLSSQGPKVIEMAGRLSGGFFATHQIPLSTGVNFIRSAIKLALKVPLEKSDYEVKHRKPVAIRYLTSNPGKLSTISGVEAAKNMPGIVEIDIQVSPGQQVSPLANHTTRLGHALATGETKQIAIDNANSALASLSISYE